MLRSLPSHEDKKPIRDLQICIPRTIQEPNALLSKVLGKGFVDVVRKKRTMRAIALPRPTVNALLKRRNHRRPKVPLDCSTQIGALPVGKSEQKV